MAELNIRGLYYLAHIDNLSLLLERGILSQKIRAEENIQYARIADSNIVGRRRYKQTPDEKSLWDYANLFFQPRNPMLYRVIDEKGKQNLTVFRIANTVLQEQGIFITDGIAANSQTQFYRLSEGLEMFQTHHEIIQSDSWISWNHDPDLRRKLMAECLVPNQVDPKYIQQFIVSDHVVANSLRGHLSAANTQKLVVASDMGSDIFTPFN
ncbi:DUF4433 domain-containing protein [Candidatus Poribacteria bacterium]|nr:DUF4433 domain-containing protein [Candidatus Poribacteria bacterium]